MLRDGAEGLDISEAQRLLADALEYFTVRLELATESADARRRRYAVKLVGGAA